MLGALTVLPTYLLGRTIGLSLAGDRARSAAPGHHDRDAGRLLLALAPAHIVVNSHIAWSNCLTPLFATLGLWLTTLALAGGARAAHRGRADVRARRQTHPTGALLLPGVALGVAIVAPAGCCRTVAVAGRTRGAAGAARTCSWPTWRRASRVFAPGVHVQAQSTDGEVLTPAGRPLTAPSGGGLPTDSLSGTLVESGWLQRATRTDAWAIARADPAAGEVAGGETLARHRALLLLLAAVTYVLLLPLINGRYESSVPKARYIAPLLPICFVAMAVLIEESRARIASPGRASAEGAPDPVGGVAAWAWCWRSARCSA